MRYRKTISVLDCALQRFPGEWRRSDCRGVLAHQAPWRTRASTIRPAISHKP